MEIIRLSRCTLDVEAVASRPWPLMLVEWYSHATLGELKCLAYMTGVAMHGTESSQKLVLDDLYTFTTITLFIFVTVHHIVVLLTGIQRKQTCILVHKSDYFMSLSF